MTFKLALQAFALIALLTNPSHALETPFKDKEKVELSPKTKDTFELIRLTVLLPDVMDAMIPAIVQYEMTGISGGNVSAEELVKLAKEKILSDSFLEKFAPAFDEIYSHDEIKTLIGFYKSDEMRKFSKNYKTVCYPIIPAFNEAVKGIIQDKCQAQIAADSVISITTETFKQEIESAGMPVVLDVYSTWCPPCRAMAPVFSKLSDELIGRVKFAKVNVDENLTLAQELKVQSMPTFLFFENGKVIARHVGVIGKEDLAGKIEEVFHLKQK